MTTIRWSLPRSVEEVRGERVPLHEFRIMTDKEEASTGEVLQPPYGGKCCCIVHGFTGQDFLVEVLLQIARVSRQNNPAPVRKLDYGGLMPGRVAVRGNEADARRPV